MRSRPSSGWQLRTATLLGTFLLTFSIVSVAQVKPHARVWLDASILQRLQTARANNSPEWVSLRNWCDDPLGQNMSDGYQFLDWYSFIMNYGLAFRVTGNQAYGNEGVKYLKAMLRDLHDVGDGQGGAASIHVDSGYVARCLGTGTAVGRDWLDGAGYPDNNGQGELNCGEAKMASRQELLLVDAGTWEGTSDLANVPRITGTHTYAPYQEWWHDAVTFDFETQDGLYAYYKIDNLRSCYDGVGNDDPSATYFRRDAVF